ncbi:MAG: glycosyltransferase [Bacillota bacterium]
MPTIVYPPTIDWHWMPQRPQHLMTRFARHGCQVYYINLTARKRPPETLAPNLSILHQREDLWSVPMPRPVVLWTSWAKVVQDLDYYGPDYVVYDCLDRFAEWLPYEEDMVRRADLVVASAGNLTERMSRLHRRVIEIQNGCEYEHFAAAREQGPLPPELGGLPGPLVMYVGAWAPWVDESLVGAVGRQLPSGSVVVIGPAFGADFCLKLPNVHYLGIRSYSELPCYLRGATAALIPFRRTEVTEHTNPIKLYEYLAAGLPVISTDLPEVRRYGHVTCVCRDALEFLLAVTEAVSSAADPEQVTHRQDVARQCSWDARFTALLTAMAELGGLQL